jgi:hypothetical protein
MSIRPVEQNHNISKIPVLDKTKVKALDDIITTPQKALTDSFRKAVSPTIEYFVTQAKAGIKFVKSQIGMHY